MIDPLLRYLKLMPYGVNGDTGAGGNWFEFKIEGLEKAR